MLVLLALRIIFWVRAKWLIDGFLAPGLKVQPAFVRYGIVAAHTSGQSQWADTGFAIGFGLALYSVLTWIVLFAIVKLLERSIDRKRENA
jgi:hypothetical protein